jgi:hypothetical protein
MDDSRTRLMLREAITSELHVAAEISVGSMDALQRQEQCLQRIVAACQQLCLLDSDLRLRAELEAREATLASCEALIAKQDAGAINMAELAGLQRKYLQRPADDRA